MKTDNVTKIDLKSCFGLTKLAQKWVEYAEKNLKLSDLDMITLRHRAELMSLLEDAAVEDLWNRTGPKSASEFALL